MSVKDHFLRLKQQASKTFFQRLNQFENGMWPTTFTNLKVLFVVIYVYLLIDPSVTRDLITEKLFQFSREVGIEESGFSACTQTCLVAALVSLVAFVVLIYVRRYLLRWLFAYRGWMYTGARGKSSVTTMLWFLAVKLVSSNSKPKLLSYQASLPRMPIPPLKNTMNKLFTSLEPLYKDKPDELKLLRQQADDFVKGPGRILQFMLHLKSWWSPNYYTDWWEKFVYLKGRSPLAVNSNFHMMDSPPWPPTKSPISRAAFGTICYLNFKKQIDDETLSPLLIQDTIPLCMSQYKRIFSTVRIPGEEMDEIQTFPESGHIAVCYKHVWFRVDIPFDVKAKAVEKTLQAIIDEVDANPIDCNSEEAMIPALTATDRTRWAQARKKLLATSEATRQAVSTIESSVFVMVLEHRSFEKTADRCKYLMHGDGRTLWFDKNIEVVIFADGHVGSNLEHTTADAPVYVHLNDDFISREIIEHAYDNKTGVIYETSRSGYNAPPLEKERLSFDLGPSSQEIRQTIRAAYASNCKNNDDLQISVVDHNRFGKGAIKKCRLSPDSFVQMAFQLAFYRDQQRFPLTYEPSLTRLYLEGRTETIRSLTSEAQAFVLAFDNADLSMETKQQLLRRACDHHQGMARDAMNALGCDRHLFALMVCARGLGMDFPFLTEILSQPWTLSTSQPPLQLISVPYLDPDIPYLYDKFGWGGGFGPVTESGYGVGYFFCAENRIYFNVSSKRRFSSDSKATSTDAVQFKDNIFKALQEMLALCQWKPTDAKKEE